MRNFYKIFKIFFGIIAVITLMGCGDKGGVVIKNGPAGPNTRDLLRPLPEGLIADDVNARHGNDDLKPNIN